MQSMIRYAIAILVALGLCASAPSCWAGFDEGLQAYEQGDYATAVREWRPLAKQGNARAQFNLGYMYEYGLGVPQDYAEAMQWYRRAADQGDAIAQNNLGLMYDNGRGVPQDYAQAGRWYRKAAEQGDTKAQFNLGNMYRKGLGVPQDYAQAGRWYRKAAEQGLAAAQFNLGLMYGTGQGVPQDDQQGYFWSSLAAGNSSPEQIPEGAVQNRDRLATRLTPAQLAAVQAQVRTWQPKPETPGTPVPSAAPSLPVSAPQSNATSSPRQDLIRQVQHRLKTQGFNPGTIDGTMGPQMQQALRWFQNSKGLLATGELDEKTLDALGLR